AAGTGASSADLSSVTGSPTVNRVWEVSTVGSDTVLTFERTVLTASGGWKVPSGVTEVDYLVLAGGGGGGAHVGGGGGGGGMLTGTNSSVSGTVVPVQVGHGGRGGALLPSAYAGGGSCSGSCASDSRQAAVGGNSVFADVETTGGGSGGHWSYFSPSSGGSGGGGGYTTYGSGTGTGASRQGYDGGKGDGTHTNGYLTGGGGGAGQWGENYSTGSTSGDGGPGRASSITGTTVTYGGGGGGGVHDSGGTAGSGGSGGGGNGAVATATQAGSGTHGLGGGGGGSGGTSFSIASKGGDGGFGAVIVRYESVREHDWTVEVWFNASSQHTANTQTIFGTFATGGMSVDNRYSARLKTNNSVSLNYRTDGSSSVYDITTQPLDDDRWYHLVAVFRDDTNLSLYLDGQFVGDTSVSGSLLLSSNDLFIGSYSNAAGGQFSQGFDGQIGLTRIYGGALNGTEVSSNYNATKGVYDNTTEISYSTTAHELTIGKSITSFTPSVANGSVVSYAISPSLPSGLNFGTSNGTVWGTPTALSSAADYIVYGNNSADSSTVTLNLSVLSFLDSLTFSPMTCNYTTMYDVQGDNGNNAALDIVGNSTYPAVQTASNATHLFVQMRLDGTPTNSQGTSLQSFMWGMQLDTNGNKSDYEHLVSYYGSGSDSLKIYNNTVTSSYDDPTDSAESVSEELTPASDYWNSSLASSSFGDDDDYLLTMILPWVALENHSVYRNGTPSFNWFGTSTSNQNLNGDFVCHDGVNDGTPQLSTTASDPVPLDAALRFTYANGTATDAGVVYYLNETVNVAMTAFTPTTSPDGATYAVHPSLPTGLSVNSTGVISGTPTQITSGANYTVYANSTVDGVNFSATAALNITINDVVPNALGYAPENMTLEKGTAMTTNTPSVSGGAVTSWEISPALPTGLSFSTSTGAISGTPSVLQTTATTYTIWANNSGGSASANINITINDQVASISYSSPVEIFNNRALSSTITPSVSGGTVTSWEITPSLPTGLTFGTSNGSIWGTPENVTSNATYTIYANNSGGSASTTLTLSINWTLTPSA
ncbi:MAG: glycine-rich domain-containing protein, partial [Poseidonia sp.]